LPSHSYALTMHRSRMILMILTSASGASFLAFFVVSINEFSTSSQIFINFFAFFFVMGVMGLPFGEAGAVSCPLLDQANALAKALTRRVMVGLIAVAKQRLKSTSLRRV